MRRRKKYGIKNLPDVKPVVATSKLDACVIFVEMGYPVSVQSIVVLDQNVDNKKSDKESDKIY